MMTYKTVLPGETIGIIGGGQLGRMMSQSAKQMGYTVCVLENEIDGPAAQVSDAQINATYDDLKALQQLANNSQVITYEFENIAAEGLKTLENYAYLPQRTDVLYATQHRLREKNMLCSIDIPVAPFKEITSVEDLHHAIGTFGMPSVLKTCFGGYDGKGQVVIRTEADLVEAENLIKNTQCVLEQWVPYTCEISAVVTRSTKNETYVFPIAENIHRNNILHQSIVPARIEESRSDEAKKIALAIAEKLNVIGTLAIEMFVTANGTIYVNELAPRPHNSGHYTMNGCNVSQFEQHVRAVCGLPLVEPTLLSPTVMVNILGEHVQKVVTNPNVWKDGSVHLYGKKEARNGRKMGHVNVTGQTVEALLEKITSWNIWD